MLKDLIGSGRCWGSLPNIIELQGENLFGQLVNYIFGTLFVVYYFYSSVV